MITKNQFIILYEKQEGRCAYCKCSFLDEAKSDRSPTVDHIIAKKNNGEDKIENLCLACRWCNAVKKDKTKDEFLKLLSPYFEGKINKRDLTEYNRFLRLKEKFEK